MDQRIARFQKIGDVLCLIALLLQHGTTVTSPTNNILQLSPNLYCELVLSE